jgi:hypothetical protein
MSIKLITILIVLAPYLKEAHVKNDPTGKNYKAIIGETCKDMTDGGCMIYTYQNLNFSKDSVVVSYQVIANCSPKERESNYNHMYDNQTKTYKWNMIDKTIKIEGFDSFSKLTFQDSKLISENKVEFNEVIKL